MEINIVEEITAVNIAITENSEVINVAVIEEINNINIEIKEQFGLDGKDGEGIDNFNTDLTLLYKISKL